MKKFLLTMMIALGAVSLGVADAEAKRVGGGGAIGRQSQNVTRQAPPAQAAPTAAKPAPAATPGATPPKPASPWKGILGGALLGLGLGALFSSMGMGGAMASMLSSILMVGLLAAAGMFIYRMIKNRSAGNSAAKPAFAGAYGQANDTPEIGSRVDSQPAAFQSAATSTSAAAFGSAASNAGNWEVPADFDVNAFLRNSKTYYIRLQAAWDRADVNDIREFTTPEMFGELRLQLQERGASANHTDVVTLDAELLGVESGDKDYLASVKFSGMIKETEQAPAEAFAEVWNMSKPVNGQGGWVLAGIQPL
ncbi:MAG: Tim44-like domain-containing protein [Pseudomonadota bacterium]